MPTINLDKSEIRYNNVKIKVIIDINFNIWVSSKDIGNVLGYKNTKESIRKNINEKYKKPYKKIKVDIIDNSIHPNTVFLNEAGLYNSLILSRKKEANNFKEWVFEDVIPEIRKYNTYKLKEKHKKK